MRTANEATTFTRLDICRFILWRITMTHDASERRVWKKLSGCLFFMPVDRLCAVCRVDFYGICPYGWLEIVIMFPLFFALFLSHSRIIFYAIYCHIVIRYFCLCLFSCCKIIRFSHFEMHQSTTTFTRTTKRNHLVPSMRKVISVNTIKLSTLKAKPYAK